MNFEEWQALMRAQRNGGTSSEIHNHEAVISNKNPNSESGNAAADELRAKQRYHNEQSKGMATDRKEEEEPIQTVYFKPIGPNPVCTAASKLAITESETQGDGYHYFWWNDSREETISELKGKSLTVAITAEACQVQAPQTLENLEDISAQFGFNGVEIINPSTAIFEGSID